MRPWLDPDLGERVRPGAIAAVMFLAGLIFGWFSGRVGRISYETCEALTLDRAEELARCQSDLAIFRLSYPRKLCAGTLAEKANLPPCDRALR